MLIWWRKLSNMRTVSSWLFSVLGAVSSGGVSIREEQEVESAHIIIRERQNAWSPVISEVNKHVIFGSAAKTKTASLKKGKRKRDTCRSDKTQKWWGNISDSLTSSTLSQSLLWLWKRRLPALPGNFQGSHPTAEEQKSAYIHEEEIRKQKFILTNRETLIPPL